MDLIISIALMMNLIMSTGGITESKIEITQSVASCLG